MVKRFYFRQGPTIRVDNRLRYRRNEAPRRRFAIIALALTVVSPVFLVVARAQERTCGTMRHVLAQFDVENGGDGVIVPVKIGSADYPFLVDTGQSFSSLDLSLRSLAGEVCGRIKGQTLLDPIEVLLYEAPKDVWLGDVRLSSVTRVSIEDLESMRRVSGYNIRGVLGMDFLRHCVVDLDPDQEKLRLLEKLPVTRRVTAKMMFANGCPYVEGRIDGDVGRRFSLDTGYCAAASVGLSSNALDTLISVSGQHAENSATILTTASGERRGGRIVRIQSLAVGDATARDIDISEVGGDLLGMTFFARFRTIFDFPNGALYLLPGRRAATPDSRDRSGLHIWRISDRILVHSVDEGSPGAKAAIKAGDELVEIDRQNAAKLNLYKIRLMLRREKVSFGLVMKRHGKTLTATLHQ